MTTNEEVRSALLFMMLASMILGIGYSFDLIGQTWAVGVLIVGLVMKVASLMYAIRVLRR